MTLQQQVCTLEQAKRLKELGVTAKPHFWWIISNYKWDISTLDFTKPKNIEWIKSRFAEKQNTGLGGVAAYVIMHELREKAGLTVEDMQSFYPAFTVAELGVMLPAGYDTMRSTDWPKDLWIAFDLDGKGCPEIPSGYATEAEARAAMLIHLLETKEITAAEVNERLNKAS